MYLTNDNRARIRQQAQQLLEEAGLLGVVPLPIEHLVKHLGYTYTSFEPGNDPDLRDIAGAVSHDEKVIYLNAIESPRRQMFTLAHEIGHIVLHREDGNTVDLRDGKAKLTHKEREANLFAAEILMPVDEFTEAWGRFSGDTNLVSAVFNTSRQAAEIRAQDLGLR